MSVLIDAPTWGAHGRLWSHLVSDESYAELHEFAARIGLPRRLFEGDHYDVPEDRYAGAVAAGARAVSGRELIKVLRASGLRIPKRKNERVVRSIQSPPELPAGSRIDVITSRQSDPPPHTVEVALALHAGGELLVRRGPQIRLPAREVSSGEPASEALRVLLADLGLGRSTPRFAGYLRHVEPPPAADPGRAGRISCYAVYAARDDQPASRALRSLPFEHVADHLWWPIVDAAQRLDQPSRHRDHSAAPRELYRG